MAIAIQHQLNSGSQVVVVGGGVAGIAAAARLAEAGVAVRLIETRQRLGGRATSFVDPTNGQMLDNCQHVLMRCCTNLIDLYQRLGVLDQIQWHRRMYFAGSGEAGRIDLLDADALPAPLHLMRSMFGFGFLRFREKLAIARGMMAIIRTSKRQREVLDGESFANWLKSHGQPQGAIEKYWQMVIVSACNESLENTSAKYALQVFQEGFLNHRDAYEMGLSSVPLVQLYDTAQKMIEQAGGTVELSTSAATFAFDGNRVERLEINHSEDIAGDLFIAALPFDRLRKLCTNSMLDADLRLRGLDQIKVSPIIGIHLLLRAPDGAAVMDMPHLVLTDSPIQWVFNKGISAKAWGDIEDDDNDEAGGPCQHLHCVISGAHDLVDRSAAELEALAVRDLGRVLPAVKKAELLHARTIKEKRATFSLCPGLDRVRPQADGAIKNLFLAGDWCDTGWPATMEGATRSGYRAAEAALRTLGVATASLLVDDLKAGWLYRLLSR
jgi:squalene-associated FAD-dependent desaturase